MSGGLVAAAVIGAGASAAAANQANKKNQGLANAANKSAGRVDSTTTRIEDPRSTGYRDDGMQAAYNAVFGTDYRGGDGQQLRVQGDPGARPVAAADGVPAGYNKRPDGRIVPNAPPAKGKGGGGGKGGGKKAAGAGGGATVAPKKFEGMSPETDAIRGQMMKLPDQNASMYGASEDFLKDTLQGEERNAYRGEAADAARAISEDPGLTEYQNWIKGQLGVGGGGATSTRQGTGGGGGGGRYVSYGTGNVAAFQDPTTFNRSATGTDAALRKLVAGEAPAGWADMEAGISRSANEGRADIIRQLKAAAVGSGSYGGSVYEDAIEGAIARGDRELADSLGAARFGAFQNALGLGTQYDLGIAGIQSNERSASAAARAAASAGAADAASRERLAMMDMWGSSLGMGQQGRVASAGALGDLAGLTSTDQRAALAGINDLAAGRRGDLGVAGDLSLGADSNRNNYISAQRQQQASNAATNAAARGQAAALAFDRERMYDPLNRLGQYAGLLDTFYGGLGSERTVGTDTRAGGAIAPYSSPWGAGASGAALGLQLGQAFQRQPTTAPATKP